ncbi:hypothetical protein V490_00426 [Pseudogymnoascus sp. VKM F-3557]|nr:hypothetical protein V490_00426 [Pseudogymnoascus sp. VKM F-3557]
MSVTTSDKVHLQQRQLGEQAQRSLKAIQDWLSTEAPPVMFTPHAEDFHLCVDPQMYKTIKPLLEELDLVTNKGVSVVRIPGPKSAPFYSDKGPAYIIPIRVDEGTKPAVSNFRK